MCYSTVSWSLCQAGAGGLTVSSVLYTENKFPVDDGEERRVGHVPLMVLEAQQTFREEMALMLH